MVVIDHNDLHKTKKEILMDLIYESTGQRFPLDKIVFGTPRELKNRPGDKLAPNTHIPINVDVGYDRRYALPESGFMYRRREIAEHLKDIDWNMVLVQSFPMRVGDLIEQINEQLEYPIKECEIDDLTYDSLEQLQLYGFIVQSADDSLLWCGENTAHGLNLVNVTNPMLTVTRLPGFMKF